MPLPKAHAATGLFIPIELDSVKVNGTDGPLAPPSHDANLCVAQRFRWRRTQPATRPPVRGAALAGQHERRPDRRMCEERRQAGAVERRYPGPRVPKSAIEEPRVAIRPLAAPAGAPSRSVPEAAQHAGMRRSACVDRLSENRNSAVGDAAAEPDRTGGIARAPRHDHRWFGHHEPQRTAHR